MPYIKKVEVISSEGSATLEDKTDIKVTAKVGFFDNEVDLNIKCKATFVLYEMDDNMDLYSIHPNWNRLFVQRAQRGGNKDDFMGFSPTFDIAATSSEQSLSHTFNDIEINDVEGLTLRLRAALICVPQITTAVRWSGEEDVTRVLN